MDFRRGVSVIHRYSKDTEVKLRAGRPAAFLLRDQWAPIIRIIDSWIIETLWWESTGTVKRYYFSVITSWWGIYELYMQDGRWVLSGDLD